MVESSPLEVQTWPIDRLVLYARLREPAGLARQSAAQSILYRIRIAVAPSRHAMSPGLFPWYVFFVIDDNGAEFRAVNIVSGHVIITIGRRQFSKDNERQ